MSELWAAVEPVRKAFFKKEPKKLLLYDALLLRVSLLEIESFLLLFYKKEGRAFL
jgi:hypothetical protein